MENSNVDATRSFDNKSQVNKIARQCLSNA